LVCRLALRVSPPNNFETQDQITSPAISST
jgi:hypothetical protein